VVAVSLVTSGTEAISDDMHGKVRSETRRSSSIAARIADSVLALTAVASIVLALAVIYRYDLRADHRSMTRVAALVYHGAPVVLAVAALAARRLRPPPKVIVTASMLLLGALACSFELYLQAERRPTGLPKWYVDLNSVQERTQIRRVAEAAGVSFDLRDRFEVIADLNRAGIDAVPLVTMPSDGGRRNVVPLVTMSDRDTVLCNESGQWIVHHTDEHGFNNPKGIWGRATIDVVALGESFTYGYCVPQDRNYVALIRAVFPGTLNVGFSGGPMLMSAVIREYVSAVQPRIVLWFHTEGIDLEDLWRQREHPLYQRYLRDPAFSQGLMHRQGEIDRELIALYRAERAARPGRARALLERIDQVAKLPLVRQRLGLGFAQEPSEAPPANESDILGEANLARFSDILTANNRQVGAWGGRFYFVYLPHWDRFGSARAVEVERSRVLTLIRAAGIPVIDTVPDFERHGDPLSLFPFRVFGHYNEAGNQVVAQAVLRRIALRPPPRT